MKETESSAAFPIRSGVLLTLLALAVRIVAAAGAELIPRDGVTYVEIAREVAADGPGAAFASIQHPLFPLLSGLLGGSEAAATLLAAVAGALGVLPMIMIGRRLGGRSPAILSGLLYAVLPAAARYQGAPLTEGLYLPLYLLAAERALAAADRTRSALPAGLAAGLAYLTRPDGLILLLALPAGLALRRRFRAAALLAVGFLALGGPYAWWISAEAGRFTLSRKKARIERLVVPERVEAELGEDRSRPGYGEAAVDLLRTWGEATSWVLLPLALAGLLLATGRRGAAGGLLVLLLFDLALRGQMLRSLGYLGRRHLLSAAALTIPLAGAGLCLVAARWRAAGAALLAGALLVTAVLPRDAEKATLRKAGLLIAERAGEGAVVATWEGPRIAYYAEGENLRLEVEGAGGADRADWVALVWERVPPEERDRLAAHLAPTPDATIGAGEWRVLLWRVRR